jgi:4'-phosphopantetheinyl transferase
MNRPENTSSPIEIWSIQLSRELNRIPECLHALTDSEKQRAEQIRTKTNSERFILTRAFLRIILSEKLGVQPSEIKFLRNENGKPFLPDTALSFNLSHSNDRLLIAVHPEQPIGIDIEHRRPIPRQDVISERWFSENERSFVQNHPNPQKAFFEIWVQKEAYVKALGGGIFQGLQDLPIPLSAPYEQKNKEWCFQLLNITDDYTAAVTYKRPCGRLIIHKSSQFK